MSVLAAELSSKLLLPAEGGLADGKPHPTLRNFCFVVKGPDNLLIV